jgi:hypothetical protein
LRRLGVSRSRSVGSRNIWLGLFVTLLVANENTHSLNYPTVVAGAVAAATATALSSQMGLSARSSELRSRV